MKDEYNLSRFIEAQERDYDRALREIKNGRKQTHWIWYIFPQIKGLGISSTAQLYAIKSLEEAKAYLDNPYLRDHLIEITNALLEQEKTDSRDLMGSNIDSVKLKSSMTLFSEIAPEEGIFTEVLDKFYKGKKDRETLRIIEELK